MVERPFQTLQKRAHFLRLQGKGRRFSTPLLTVQGASRPSGEPWATSARIGLIVTKKMGGAVQRNRIKRRLRGALDRLPANQFDVALDYVILAKPALLACDFQLIVRDLGIAFNKVLPHKPNS